MPPRHIVRALRWLPLLPPQSHGVGDGGDRAPIEVPFELAWASPFFARSEERYLRAKALQETGRQEAAIFYEAHGKTWADLIFGAASQLGLAEIYDALGDTAEATLRYNRFVRLWRDCDPALRPFVEKAQLRFAELSAER